MQPDTHLIVSTLKANARANKVDQEGKTLPLIATILGLTDVVEVLLDRDADPNEDDILAYADIFGPWKVAVLQIQYRTVLRARRHNLHRLLYAAATYGNTELVRILLSARAKSQHKNYDGKTRF